MDRPERGAIRPYTPAGSKIEMPVGTHTVSLPLREKSIEQWRSYPTAPGEPRDGRMASEFRRLT